MNLEALNEIPAIWDKLSASEKRLILAELDAIEAELSEWKPLPGPQTQAYHSKADILFYGGSAGAGKTDLLLGLALKAHHTSIIFRREYKQFRGIVKRGKELIDNTGKGKFNKVDYVWNLKNGGSIELGACKDLGDEEKFQGIPHDLKGFDEITHFYESQFRYLCGWLRNTSQVRKRIICTGNPPMNSDGDWVIRYWAPWLDKKHPNPAAPGELRWFTTIDGKETEFLTGDIIYHKNEIITPESRTFIPGKVDDNPYLLDAGYKTRLQALGEPMRSKMLFGDFSAGREDDAWQIIPTEWVHIAQARWEARSKPEMLMTALGVDVARGGADMTILSPRYGNFYDKQKEFTGSSTPDGPMVAGQVLANMNYGTQINVDVIGVGSSVYDILMSHNLKVDGINGASGSEATDKTGFFGFLNRRAELWWKFREALDPESGEDICLPPGNELLADLCTPRYKVTTRGIQVESKEEIIKRIGRSPDRGDSIVYASAPKQSGISFTVI